MKKEELDSAPRAETVTLSATKPFRELVEAYGEASQQIGRYGGYDPTATDEMRLATAKQAVLDAHEAEVSRSRRLLAEMYGRAE